MISKAPLHVTFNKIYTLHVSFISREVSWNGIAGRKIEVGHV